MLEAQLNVKKLAGDVKYTNITSPTLLRLTSFSLSWQQNSNEGITTTMQMMQVFGSFHLLTAHRAR